MQQEEDAAVASLDARITASSRALESQIWPIATRWFPKATRLIRTEVVKGERMCADFDMKAHVNGYASNGRGLITIASRVQWVEKSFNSHTIRYARRTGQNYEWQTLCLAIDRGGVYPEWMIHGYVHKASGNPLAVGMARTRDLIAFLRQVGEHYFEERHMLRENPEDGTLFIVAYWDAMERAGVDLQHWPDDLRGPYAKQERAGQEQLDF